MKTFLFIVNVFITFIITSCSVESDIMTVSDPLQPYIAFGQIHNSMLEKTEEAIEDILKTRGKDFNPMDWVELHELQKAQIQYMNISDEHKIMFTTALDDHFNYYNMDYIWESFTSNNSNGVSEAVEMINQLYAIGIIDIFERNLLYKLNKYIIQQKSDTNFAILSSIQGLADQWRNYYGVGGNIDINKKGIFSAYILGICLSSAEWWEDNPESAAPVTRVAPWVYADACGALRSGLYAIIQQQVQNNLSGEVDWERVVYAALAGGVITSTTGLKQVAAIIVSFLF